MAGADREEAKRRREEARRSRRSQGETEEPAGAEEPLETVKQAAKTAAAAAAVGAAVGAARAAIGGKDGHDGDEDDVEEPVAEEPQEPQESQERDEPPQPQEHEEERRRSGASVGEASRVVQAAREQLAALLGKQPDSVSAFERTDEGWVVTLEVVEVSRIPESTDVLASYELTLDGDRNLLRYRRSRRYYRAQADAGDGS